MMRIRLICTEESVKISFLLVLIFDGLGKRKGRILATTNTT